MLYGLLADAVLLLHVAFMLFVGPGGLLLLKWPKLAWLQLPAVSWAVWISFSGNYCPLTPLEQWLRELSGAGGYTGSFTSRYIEPLIYPAGLTQPMQWGIGATILLFNIAIYGAIYLRLWRRASSR